jgi:hypothetical protein
MIKLLNNRVSITAVYNLILVPKPTNWLTSTTLLR